MFKSFADAKGSNLVEADFDLNDARTAGRALTRHAPAAGAVVTRAGGIDPRVRGAIPHSVQ